MGKKKYLAEISNFRELVKRYEEYGENIAFKFRGEHMEGTIEKLLTNSAIVVIDWDNSPKHLYDLMEEKTVVNFKDIDAFLKTFNMNEVDIEDVEE